MGAVRMFNGHYHESSKKGVISAERVKVDLVESYSPKLGIVATVLIKFKTQAIDKAQGPESHAYAAKVLFPDLSKRDYDKVVDQALLAHGPGEKAAEFATKKLMESSRGVAIFKDDQLLAHPLVKEAIGKPYLQAYQRGQNVGMAGKISISRQIKDIVDHWALISDDGAAQPVPAPARARRQEAELSGPSR